MDYPPVANKPDFTRRYVAGEFGNAAPSWNTLEEFLRSGYRGKIHIRNREAAGETWYNIDSRVVETVWYEVLKKVEGSQQLYLSAMCPHDRGTIQGEVMQSLYGAGLDLLYTDAKKPMREALALKETLVSGIMATLILREAMCPNSWEWLQVLLDHYEGHVVEFTCFEIPWGTLWPRFNTVIWEVRRY